MKQKSEFKNEKEFYKYLSANKSELIAFKKAALKFTDSFGVEAETQKTLSTNNVDDIANGIIKRTIIGNTYNWMDSHDDVHVENTFGKSIAERQDKIWHLHDHEQKITSKVGKPTSIYEKQIAWKDLGIEKEGRTICLCMDSNIMKDMNVGVFGQYLAKEITQHSVAMKYIDINMAINDPECKQEYSAGDAIEAKGLDFMKNVELLMESHISKFNTTTIYVDNKDIETVFEEIKAKLDI